MTDFEEVLTEVNAVEQMVHQLHMSLIAKLLEQREALEHKPMPAYSVELIEGCRLLAKYKVVPKGSTVEVTSKFYETAVFVAQQTLGIMGVMPDDTDKEGKGGVDGGVLRDQLTETAIGLYADRFDAEPTNEAGSRDWRDEVG